MLRGMREIHLREGPRQPGRTGPASYGRARSTHRGARPSVWTAQHAGGAATSRHAMAVRPTQEG